MKKMYSASLPLVAALVSLWGAAPLQADMHLTLKSDFPGGNVTVDSNEGSTVHISPDLRTSPAWFYWYFEAEASEPGQVTFVFNGAKVGVRGPAVSLDEGKTWAWMGTEHVVYAHKAAEAGAPAVPDSFTYNFTKAHEKVRFSVGFPYVQSNLDEFLKKNASNPNMAKSILATTTHGLPVELLQIGKPGPGIVSMAVSARSHCCEALASYILEGFLQEAMSDSPAGVEFRKKYVLFAVPMLDKDGVQAGDQGKNRAPHDHNRDYGVEPNLYPEIKAFEALAHAQHVQVGIDFHCPALRGDIHEVFHWLGLKIPYISNNIDELAAWMGEERPAQGNTPLNFLAKPSNPPKTDGIPFSWYFAYLDNSLLAVTLESPYAKLEDVDTARAYGGALLRALVRTEMITAAPDSTRKDGGHAAFEKFSKQLTLLATHKPEDAQAMAEAILKDPSASPVYRVQANLGMATVCQRQKKFAEAVTYANAAKAEPEATHLQKGSALIALVSIRLQNPDSAPADIEAALKDFEAYPYPSPLEEAAVYMPLSSYYETKGDYPKALLFAQKCLKNAISKDKAADLLRIADVFDLMGKKDEATATRKEVVAMLRPQLIPTPLGRGIFTGVAAGQLFDALAAIPTATLAEKVEAAKVVLTLKALPVGLKPRVEDWMKQNAPQDIPQSAPDATPETAAPKAPQAGA